MNEYKHITKKDAKLYDYNFDITTILKTDEDIQMYLDVVLEDEYCTEKDIQRALGDIARAKGMSKVAEDIKADRTSLYKTFDEKTDAKFSTIFKLIKSFGLKIKLEMT